MRRKDERREGEGVEETKRRVGRSFCSTTSRITIHVHVSFHCLGICIERVVVLLCVSMVSLRSPMSSSPSHLT